MKLYIATDHRAHEVEEKLINNLKKLNLEIITSKIPHSSDDDYVDFAIDMCSKMNKREDIGIVICGNGVGMSIIANKIKGIRCARVLNNDDAKAARQHNGANAIALGTTTVEEMSELITTFVSTPLPTEERHLRRMNKIIKYEAGEYNGL